MSSIILGINALSQPPREAVSWNIWGIDMKTKRGCQPPREAVSWNTETGKSVKSGSPSASSWGCELKYVSVNYREPFKSQPPREAVSWNIICISHASHLLRQPPREAVSWNGNDTESGASDTPSASSWGCELKCTWVRIPVWGQASCEVAYSTRYNKDSPTSIGGEMNCKQENERQWRAERNRYPPLTWGKSQSACLLTCQTLWNYRLWVETRHKCSVNRYQIWTVKSRSYLIRSGAWFLKLMSSRENPLRTYL